METISSPLFNLQTMESLGSRVPSPKDSHQLQGNPISIEQASLPSQEEIADALRSANAKAQANLEKEMQAFASLEKETQRVLKEVAEEQPSLLSKQFDFTNIGEEIEVINHNLTDREYSYLKSKLNANDKLVEATDFFNQLVADSKNAKVGSSRNYTKEDVAGRVQIMNIFSELQNKWDEQDERSQQWNELNAKDKWMYQNGKHQILQVNLPVKEKV